MAQYCHHALQEIVRNVLIADAELTAKVLGVFDFVPEKTPYPYITLGETRAEDESTVGVHITRMVLAIQVYSRGKGRREADDIMAAIHRLLGDGAAEGVEAAGYTVVELRYAGSEINQLRDGATFQGRMRFTARLQKETV